MNDVIRKCLEELQAERGRLDEAIEHLKLLSGEPPRPTRLVTPRKVLTAAISPARGKKRGPKPKDKTKISAHLLCTVVGCSLTGKPFKSPLGLKLHTQRKHPVNSSGAGLETRSLISSSLSGGSVTFPRSV